MREFLVDKLPDEKITTDLRQVVAESNSFIQLEHRDIKMDSETKLEIVGRSYHCYNFDIGFGDHYRVCVAIGGVTNVAHGVPEAAKCFATMWYSVDRRLITVDFATQMP